MRRTAIALGAVTLTALGIHALSEYRVRAERKAHARDDDALYRVTRGSGPPILFIPGFLGTTRYWGDTVDALESDHRLVFVDTLGFGRSPWPDVDYTLDDHLNALRATVVEEVGTSTLTIVGHSFGALLGAYYAAKYGGVDRVVLLGLPIFEDARDARARIGALAPLARVFVLNETAAAMSCDVLCAFRPLIREWMPTFMPDRRPEVAKDGVLHTWPSFDGTLRNVLMQKPARDPVMAIGRSTIIVHADADEVSPAARARALAAASGARFVEVTGGHHDYLGPALVDLLRE